MKIQVLGPGCPNCDRLYANVQAAVEKGCLQGQVTVEKVQDIDYFLTVGVFVTPALVIDGKAVSAGRVLTRDQVLTHIEANAGGPQPE